MTAPYSWHSKALAGEKPPITYEPECGWFVMRFKRGEPFIPCRIFWEGERDADGELISDEKLRCEIGGQRTPPDEAWTFLAKRPVTEAEYLARMAAFVCGVSYDLNLF